MVYHKYKDTLKGTGKMSMKIAHNFATPLNGNKPEDVEAASRVQGFSISMMAYPLSWARNIPN